MRIPACLAAAALALSCAGEPPVPQADPSSLRVLAQGAVVGHAHPDHDAHVWRGIPFARPPTHALRWRAPLPPTSWSGTRQALEPGAECAQLDMRDAARVVGDEDCLTLDVYAPRFAAEGVPDGEARLPVMVWIHGGGNSVGSAQLYDASRLAAEGGVVVVALQYRLGIFGWLSHPALRAGATGPEDASGNFALLDVIRGLEWVQQNAAAFGGDPGKVTVFGESAGGVNVFGLLLSPRAEGLFHRAISQSGILRTTPLEEAEAWASDDYPRAGGSQSFLAEYLLRDGVAHDRESARETLAGMRPDAIAVWLRGKSSEELLAIFQDSPTGGMYFVPALHRDGHVIVDAEPLDALATPGLHNAVPTIAGTNLEETKLFAMLSSPHVRRIFGVPVGLRDVDAFDREGRYGGLVWKAQGADEPLAALHASGQRSLYGYRFDWDEEGRLLWLDLSELLGASHAVDLFFTFGFLDLGRWTDTFYADPAAAARLSEQVRSYWTHFARTGSPARGRDGDLPEWTPFGQGGAASQFLAIDGESAGGPRMRGGTVTVSSVAERLASDPRIGSERERCRLFQELVRWSGAYTRSDYAAFAAGRCVAWPLPEPERP